MSGKVIRVVLYVVLVLNAALAFMFSDQIALAAARGDAPPWAPAIAPAAFAFFVTIYAVDRVMCVRRRVMPFGRAFFQIALAVVVLTLLWDLSAAPQIPVP